MKKNKLLTSILFISMLLISITSNGKMLYTSDILNMWNEKIITIPVTVTAYSSTVDQCDNDPFITASNKRVERGVIALSRNLLKKFNKDAPFDFGHEIWIIIDGDSLGPFIVEDTMNKKWKNRVDIWHPTREEASKWGIKKGLLVF